MNDRGRYRAARAAKNNKSKAKGQGYTQKHNLRTLPWRFSRTTGRSDVNLGLNDQLASKGNFLAAAPRSSSLEGVPPCLCQNLS